jgi:hypothetical protein
MTPLGAIGSAGIEGRKTNNKSLLLAIAVKGTL